MAYRDAHSGVKGATSAQGPSGFINFDPTSKVRAYCARQNQVFLLRGLRAWEHVQFAEVTCPKRRTASNSPCQDAPHALLPTTLDECEPKSLSSTELDAPQAKNTTPWPRPPFSGDRFAPPYLSTMSICDMRRRVSRAEPHP